MSRGSIFWQGHRLGNLDDCWRHPSPPLELLQEIKNAAKPRKDTPGIGSELALPIRSALYLTSIAAAKVKYGKWITGLSPSEFEERFQEVSQYEWIDAESIG